MPSPPRPAAARDLEARLSRIEAALASNPELAEREAREILAGAPDHPMALLFQAIARRRMGDPAAAVAVLESLCRNEPNAPLPHLQLGLALRETGDDGTALTAMQRAVAVKPDFSDAWLALADLRTALGDRTGAEAAFMHYLRYSSRDPLFLQAASLIRENRAGEAEKLLREQLGHQPRDLRALFMLAELANGHSRFEDAEKLLTACLELAPGYAAARHNLAVTLMRQNKLPEALRQADRVVADDPEAADALNLRAAVLLRMLEYDDAIDVYRQILRRDPQHVTVWSNLGHTLRTVGRLDESILAYRRCIALDPSRGEAWWNLANLKTVALSDSDLDSMRAQAERSDVGQTDRVHLHFAIGKALEDRQAFAESFAQYAEGNRLRREMLRYDPDELAGHVARC
ncbi:MAG TPA: tetratricopeptide repeat protein, partial [Woeseiaceae bacterium]|nr:tetratricopeptide repeat protein [Woeseiaceae bacterium]